VAAPPHREPPAAVVDAPSGNVPDAGRLTTAGLAETLAPMPHSVVEPFAVAPGEGLSVENPTGGQTTFTALAEATGGALTAIRGEAAPGEGPPLHVHPDQDELIYTLEGRYRVRLGDSRFDAPPGTFIFIPRGTEHTWQNTGATPARFFAAFTPAAPQFEQFFVRYAELPPHERGAGAFARLADETRGMEVVGPPLAETTSC
jgi:quercetin dioxygenase-like cupin family protein